MGRRVKALLAAIIMISALFVPLKAEGVCAADIFEADITFLRDAISSGRLKPSKIAGFYLDRIEEYNKTWNCFITLCDDVTAQAEEKDRLLEEGKAEGKLFGIPIVVKDNIDVAGLPTTNGYKLTSSATYIAEKDSAIVAKLRKEGAVIIGKTNMSTEAQEARETRSKAVGETVNAYSTSMACGGSSGGSAVSVSLNFAAAGLGTDTGSSLRYPAVLNGCVSLRTTREMIDRDGIVILNSVRDVPGVITRSVRDQAIILDIMTDGRYGFEERLDGGILNGMKIGILKELSYATKLVSDRTAGNLDTEIQKCFEAAAENMRSLGAEVVEVSMNNLYSLKNGAANNNSAQVSKYRSAFKKLLDDNGITAVIFPTYLSSPLKSGVNENGEKNVYQSVYINNSSLLSPPTGCPEMAVTIGYHSTGVGIGMEICGWDNSDATLLSIAYAYLESFPTRQVPEGAPNLVEYVTTEDMTVPVTETEETSDGTEKTISSGDTDEISSSDETSGTSAAMHDETKQFLILILIFVWIVLLLFIVRWVNMFRNRRRRRTR